MHGEARIKVANVGEGQGLEGVKQDEVNWHQLFVQSKYQQILTSKDNLLWKKYRSHSCCFSPNKPLVTGGSRIKRLAVGGFLNHWDRVKIAVFKNI